MSLSNDQKKEIEDITKILFNEFNKDHDIINFNDPFKIISLLDKYIVIRYPLDDNHFKSSRESLSGFSTTIDDYKCIYINSNHVLGRQYFSCWHEFYHSIDDSIKLTEEDYLIVENKADHFALCMMLSSEKINQYLNHINKKYNSLDLDDLIIMQNTLRVSFSALLRRLKELYGQDYSYYHGIASVKRSEEFQAKTKSLGFDIDLITPTYDIVLPTKYIDAMISNIKNNRIDINKANYILDILESKEVKFLW